MTYRPSPISRSRRTKVEMDRLRYALYEIVEHDKPMTVRQVFYRAVSAGIIAKTEAEYKQTIVRLLSEMRRSHDMPYSWIADNTRWVRKPPSFESLSDALEFTRETYRRALWSNQDHYCEIWLEKDALSGVLLSVTGQWDVPLMVTRGYPSLTFLHTAAEEIASQGKPAYLYYLGDRDPSGLDIPKRVERDLRSFAPDAEIHFERIAVTEEQVEAWNLPTRPTKKSDSRAKGFKGESVEVDAIEPDMLRGMVETVIAQHVDAVALDRLQRVEALEVETLAGMIERGLQ